MTQIIAVSKSSKNVLTSTDPNDFIFHSSFNTFKIITSGTYSPTLGVSSGAETSLAHGQSIKPFVIAFCKFSNGRVGSVGNKSSDEDFWFTNLKVDSTYIYFSYVNLTSGNYQPTFRYYICEVPL